VYELQTVDSKFLVSTPLELFRRLRLDAELIGDMNSLTSSLNLELEPIMGKVKVVFTSEHISSIFTHCNYGIKSTISVCMSYRQLTLFRWSNGD
jgi:hypothetical protein